jgi:hypothetical protein
MSCCLQCWNDYLGDDNQWLVDYLVRDELVVVLEAKTETHNGYDIDLPRRAVLANAPYLWSALTVVERNGAEVDVIPFTGFSRNVYPARGPWRVDEEPVPKCWGGDHDDVSWDDTAEVDDPVKTRTRKRRSSALPRAFRPRRAFRARRTRDELASSVSHRASSPPLPPSLLAHPDFDSLAYEAYVASGSTDPEAFFAEYQAEGRRILGLPEDSEEAEDSEEPVWIDEDEEEVAVAANPTVVPTEEEAVIEEVAAEEKEPEVIVEVVDSPVEPAFVPLEEGGNE